VVAIAEDLIRPDRRHGLVIVNGHGGNWASLVCVAQELGSRSGEGRIAVCSWWQLAEETIAANHQSMERGAGHAGELETSAMMAALPMLVRKELVPESTADQRTGALIAQATHYQWIDFKRLPNGVEGFPRTATSHFGAVALEAAGSRLAELAAELSAHRTAPGKR
jgi:creatinine amidohydrolase